MSKYADLAMERRGRFTPEGRPAWNCCQAVVSVFAQDAGYDEDTSMKAATYFRGGMQTGAVCGAVTGSLLALGLAGVDDPQAANSLIRKVLGKPQRNDRLQGSSPRKRGEGRGEDAALQRHDPGMHRICGGNPPGEGKTVKRERKGLSPSFPFLLDR